VNPWISVAAGALAGYALLALAILWLLNLCLPVSTQEIKWQCQATFWLVGLAYFAASFVATFLARRGAIPIALAAFVVLLLGHAFLPDLAIVSFGKRWYLDAHTLYFAVVPAMLGVAAASLAFRQAHRKAER
jgi:hypothetical protein